MKRYILNSICGVEFEILDDPALNTAKLLAQIFSEMGFKVEMSRSNEFRYALMWANSVLSFYELGLE